MTRKKLALLFVISFTIVNTVLFNQYIFNSSNKRESSKVEPISKPNEIDYVNRYDKLLDCKLANYDVWQTNFDEHQSFVDRVNKNNEPYAKEAADKFKEMRIVRGILVYYPLDKGNNFELELRWLYRSWIEAQSFEPKPGRTDLIVFVENKRSVFNNSAFFLNKLDCSFKNVRTSSLDKPMCTLIDYVAVKERNLTKKHLDKQELSEQFTNVNDEILNYDYLLNKVNLFHNKSSDYNGYKLFYYFLKKRLSNYGYVDSILMAFDGYDYFKRAGYNFLIRSDMDVFLTPLFAKWAPKYCNDFYVGGGGYSDTFNVKRLKRVAKELDLKHAGIWNLGSTWYSTPEQFRLVAYLTLFGMAYLSEEEFTPPEREGKVGTINWPYWHYGVLLLYGQNLAMNHLIATHQLNIVKLDKLFDVESEFSSPINQVLHIHVYHGAEMFSKFQFKDGQYDNLTTESENTNQIKFYCLKMALESKFNDPKQLNSMLRNLTSLKN